MAKLSASQIAGIVKYEGAGGAGTSFAHGLYKPDTDGPIFVAIALVESSGETTATHKNSNGTTDYGLWQINSVHKELLATYPAWQNPNDNFRMAVALYHNRDGKFNDWTTYNSGLYATRMTEAVTAWNNPDMTQTEPNAVGDAFNTAGNAVSGTVDFISAITKSSTWIRVGMGAAGVVLLLMVVAVFMKDRLPLPGPLGAVAKAGASAGAKAAEVAK